MWITLGFLALGFLIGNLVGMTATSVVTSLLGLLFAFAGGSVITVMHRLNAVDRNVAGKALAALSLACVVGIYSGVYVCEHRLLSPPPKPGVSNTTDHAASPVANSENASPAANKYVMAEIVSETQAIDQQLAARQIKPEEAYRRLREVVEREAKQ